ncbi:MAG: ABC transporter permease [Chloroflexi bacterium]|nr:ABC transporter permease [Chloroflexota bacterium]
MKKILLVLKNEIVTLISRPSFWLAALGLPLVGALVFALAGWLNRDAAAAQTVSQVVAGPQTARAEGYVDLSGIVREVPASVPPGTFVAYPSEEAARAALEAGEISAFYIVAADYIQTGAITYVRPDFNPLSASSDQSGMFNWVVEVNLAGGDMLFASLVNGPLDVQVTSLAPAAPQFEEDSPLGFLVPYIVTLLFYMLIISSASLLLGSISKEKENRVMEVLLTSVTPRQLLTGKILGLGIVGLAQTVIWLGMGYTLMNLSGRTFDLAVNIGLPASFLAWGLVFFLLGYAVYASLMAGLGALAPNLREATQATFVVMLPLMIPLFFSSSVFAEDPHGPIATTLSIFPLTSPVAMMARLASGGVTWWQPWLAVLLLAGTAVLIVRAVAGMFRAQALLAGQGFSVKGYFKALVGK